MQQKYIIMQLLNRAITVKQCYMKKSLNYLFKVRDLETYLNWCSCKQQPVGALIKFQLSVEFARSILYPMAFINYDVMPWDFAKLRPVMLVHQEFVSCHQDIELLWLDLLSAMP